MPGFGAVEIWAAAGWGEDVVVDDVEGDYDGFVVEEAVDRSL